LIRQLGDKDSSVRNSAVEELEQTGESAVRSLIKALEDEYWVIRQRSAETLGRISDPRAVGPLIAALGDKNRWVRIRAVEALGRLGDRRAVGPLINTLADTNELIRRHAAESLGLIGDRQAIEALVTTLKDKSPNVRTVAAKALEAIRSSAAPGEQTEASEEKQANTMIKKLIDLKIYVGAGIGAFLLLGGLIIVLVRR
jgi:HEAT repeat protein